MTSDRKKRRAAKRTPEFPALREFFSGYLHQDFHDEYGSAVGAAQAFRRDASDSEVNKYRRRKSQKQCVNWDRHGGRRVLRIWIK
jgi:hypothetical protein